MTVRLSTGLRNLLAGTKGFGAAFDGGVIHIYSGPQPITADAPVNGVLLGIVSVDAAPFNFGNPANGLTFGTPSNGTVEKTPGEVWRFVGQAAGTAGWFRLMGNAFDNLGNDTAGALPRLDGTVGTTNADLLLTNLSIAVGAPNTIDAFSFTFPAQ